MSRACTPAISLSANGRAQVQLLGLLLILMLVVRLLAMAVVPLVPEEAYYWMYAQHPALSYYDHPPMVAGVIALGTTMFGDNEFGVRAVGFLLSLGASLLLYRFTEAWFSRSAACLAALLLHILPVYYATGFVATMDSTLMFFWLLCLNGVSSALRNDRARGWYVAGIALGLALLSKYTAVFLPGGTFLALVVHSPWRRHLRTPHPYLALLLAVALFSPVILWNAAHDWASFRFQFVERWRPAEISLSKMLNFIGFQLLVLTPILFIAVGRLAASLTRGRRRPWEPRYLISLAFSVPLLLVMTYKALRYEVHLNWTLPAYISLLPAVSQWMISTIRRRHGTRRGQWLRRLVASSILVNVGLSFFLIVLEPRLRYFSAFGPWDQLVRVVDEQQQRLERTTAREPVVVAGGKYGLASILAFYRRPLEHDVDPADFTTSQWMFGGSGLGYAYWSDTNCWLGRDVVYISDSGEDVITRLRPFFSTVKEVTDQRLHTAGGSTYRIAIGTGLRRPQASSVSVR